MGRRTIPHIPRYHIYIYIHHVLTTAHLLSDQLVPWGVADPDSISHASVGRRCEIWIFQWM